MSKTFLVLGVLMALVTCFHILGGGPVYADAFIRELPTTELRGMSMVLWHAVTVMLAHLSLAYLWLARDPNAGLVHFTSAFQVGWSGLFIYYGLTIVGNLWVMPQWIGFLAFAAAAELALKYHPKRTNP